MMRCARRGWRSCVKPFSFAQDVGIRVIQLAGYDVYYQEANDETRRRFRDGLKESVEMASRAQVTLAMEIMDYPLMNSISKALGYAHYLNNPWFQLYPDIGNLSAWDNDVQMELQAGWAYRGGTRQRYETRRVQKRAVRRGGGFRTVL
jgi:L-ribulose-5-phosphate 3-epimerase